MIKFTLKQLIYFVAAADHKSIAEASKHVHVAQPAVASAINKLETYLGVDLMVRRHAQGVSLTPAGARVLVEAKNLIRHIETFQENARSLGADLTGDVALGCYRSLAPVFLPSIMHAFRQKYSSVNISMKETDQEGLEKGIRTGEFELGLLYDLGLPPDMEFFPVYEGRLSAVLPPGHALARKRQVSLHDLVQEPFILLNTSVAKQFFTAIFDRYKLRPKTVLYAPSLEVLRGMVGWDLGVSLLVARPASEITYDGHRIELRPVKEDVPSCMAGLVRLRQLRLTACAQEFLNFCTADDTKEFLGRTLHSGQSTL